MFNLHNLFSDENSNAHNLISCSSYIGYVYETFGISEHFLVKIQQILIRATPLDKSLTAKCFIYDVVCWPFFKPSFNQFIFAARFPCQALEREGLKGSCHKFGFGRAQSVYVMCLSAKGWCELIFY